MQKQINDVINTLQEEIDRFEERLNLLKESNLEGKQDLESVYQNMVSGRKEIMLQLLALQKRTAGLNVA